ncbi:MAG: alkaline phosphatase [Odoribacter sp.]
MNKFLVLVVCCFLCSASIVFSQGKDQEITVVRKESSVVKQVKASKNGKIKNVVLMVGDGMSLSAMYSAWAVNKGELNLESCQAVGLAKTYCFDRMITDSGAAGTALATGHKTRYHSVGVDPDGKPLKSLVDLSAARQKSTGIVVTCELNDATPAAFCAHNVDRSQADAIISDYVDCGVDFIFGGGRCHFDERSDGRNIFKEMQAKGYQLPLNLEELKTIKEGKVLAVWEKHNLPQSAVRKDLLAQSSMNALCLLSQNKKGFFLMIEGSQIDHCGHSNSLEAMMEEALDFDRVVGQVFEWAAADGETLVVVTADHETGGLTLVGGSLESGEIVGKFSTENHSGVMVPVYAFGPGSDWFTGIYENTDIFEKIKHLLKL